MHLRGNWSRAGQFHPTSLPFPSKSEPRSAAVVNVTSDKCYENREWVWGYRENERMGGHDPYSNSKGCAELVTSAFRDSFFPPAELASHGVALASVRAGNAIGGGDWTANQLIPDLMRAFLAGNLARFGIRPRSGPGSSFSSRCAAI